MGVDVTDEDVTAGLRELSEPVSLWLGANPPKDELEQWMCFAAAVWNATVVHQFLQDRSLVHDLCVKVESFPEPSKSVHSEMLLAMAEVKLTKFPSAGWVYRGVHVLVAREGLRVRAEAISIREWIDSGRPMRMGLVQ